MSNLHTANPRPASRTSRHLSRLWLIVTVVAFIAAAIALTYGWTAIFGAGETSQITPTRDVPPPPQETKAVRVTTPPTPSTAKTSEKEAPRSKPTVPASDQKPLW